MSADAASGRGEADLRFCAVIPTLDNPQTLPWVVEGVRCYLDDVLVCDDGSGPRARAVIDDLARAGLVSVWRGERNRGKGAAVQAGFRVAAARGASHVLQVDADGQHDLAEIPAFLAAARREPRALVLGYPVFDESAPRSRVRGRAVSRFWVDLEVGAGAIADPLVGFRVYPLDAVLALRPMGDGMEFDTEVIVRLAWRGSPIVNLPVGVRYLSVAEGGVSHFRPVLDNVRISWLHTRLFTRAMLRHAFANRR
jgi:glycosyltransferase involved in cell wall biosynthesis